MNTEDVDFLQGNCGVAMKFSLLDEHGFLVDDARIAEVRATCSRAPAGWSVPPMYGVTY